jgi:alkanesulfonate monooxygenase SsuD/methylene tetrahydromethanopterin reductase-like flavin-dependent oxidoreductase (luciferase family)
MITGRRDLDQANPGGAGAISAGTASTGGTLDLTGAGTPGWTDQRFRAVQDAKIRVEMMHETIDTIPQIWAQDPPYEIHGKYWNINITQSVIPELGIGSMSKPYQRPHPPIVMSAMSPSSSSVRTAAGRGWGVRCRRRSFRSGR